MDKSRKKEKIKACIAIGLIILAILIVGIIELKYSVEGEKNIPFNISKITMISTAEGIENIGAEEKWNLSIYQNNDIYIFIEKNEENKEDALIESVSIENIKVIEEPKVGEIKAYMPNSLEGRMFLYNDEYQITDSKLTYKGSIRSDEKKLEIGNQGGKLMINFSNVGLGNYISNDDEEVKHDGTIISKLNLTKEDVSFSVNFDLIIKLKNKKYKSNITLELPCGENLVEEGQCSEEITDGFIFKRTKE